MHIYRNDYQENTRLKDESIFTCSSGTLGIRGCFEEGCPEDSVSIRGAYINGFCETEDIKYNEKLYGFTDSKQTIVNLPDSQGIEFYVNDNKICCWSKKANDYHYELDMQNGVVKRHFVYDTDNGLIDLSFERFVSFTRPNLFAIRCKVTSLSYNGKFTLKSLLDGNVKNFTIVDDPRVASGNGRMLKVNSIDNILFDDKNIENVEVETINSHRKVSTSVINRLTLNGCLFNDVQYSQDHSLLTCLADIEIKENDSLIFEKYCYYREFVDHTSYDELIKAYDAGFDYLLAEQKEYMNKFWAISRVVVDCDEIKQENLDFALYSLLSAASKDGTASVAAKGLSGEGYEGHYFWDCETYIYPFFLLTNKDTAKSLLLYRYSVLDKAKEHARELGHYSGALYPWRTITGSECSSYYPSGSAQYHINGDIARAFIDYWYVTKDIEMLPIICEVLLETSRLWINVGHFDNDLFKIDCVTGPDEYTCMVNNNYYTNAGAKNNLLQAVKLINELKKYPGYDKFVAKTEVKEDELVLFGEAGNKMYLPYDEKIGIIKQDDSFLNKKKLDIDSIPKDNFPLLLHYHPMFLYRHQICKQADAVLADYLFTNLDASTSMRTYEYYEKVTTHDSSLSKCIYGIMAAKLGNLSKAKDYFIETLSTDLDDCKGNTRDGLHMANMGGCYCMVTDGFAGLRINEDNIYLFPMLPDGINSYSFSITYRGRVISVSVDALGTKLKVINDAEPIVINVYGDNEVVGKTEILVKRVSKAIIFDLDGVITDTAVYHYQAWKKIADELHVDFDEIKNEQFKGVSRYTCLVKLLEWGNISVSQDKFNELLERKNNYYKELLAALTPDNVLPGIRETLNILHEKGIKVALFSVSRNTDTIIDRLKIRDFFDVIVTGNDVKHSKPHYDGYLLAADRLGLDPRLCTMVEDSIAGINGAKALAMNTIAIMKENAANADICIDSTDKLVNILNFL
ncbi:MAG: beta-phosphoglucomutase [Erysipelotrichaceae bacterium]|nr:beta-phosphoglucomutase [Erysipelotrichaceae bacterium]